MNEQLMKKRGEDRVWKDTVSKQGVSKRIHTTQVGQQFLLEESIRIFDDVKDWIENKSPNINRSKVKRYFKEDDVLLTKITETFLILASSFYLQNAYTSSSTSKKGVSKNRHRSVKTVVEKVFQDSLEFEIAWRFIEVCVDYSKFFQVTKETVHIGGGFDTRVHYTSNLDEAILEKLTKDAQKSFFPQPLTVPPLPWKYEKKEVTGGYETFQYDLVRAGSFKVDYSKFGDKIFETVNYVQSCPWRVCQPVLDQIMIDMELPKKEDFIKSEYPESEGCEWDIDVKSDTTLGDSKIDVDKIKKAREIFSEKANLYRAEAGDFESAMGKYRAVKLAVSIADEYREEDSIYFPHSYDFRGRVYPIPVGLSPQGSDAVKAMIEYKNGQVLNEVGEKWAWAYLASLYGEDKLDFEERIDMGKSLLYDDYKNADEPYQFLAHQLELQKFVEDPTIEFKGRIHLDACNSGSQFTSALTGDLAGCLATNVIPTISNDGVHTRQDAYLLVAEKALELTRANISVESDKDIKASLRVLENLLVNKGRKLVKTSVMVSTYGGTARGRAEIIYGLLREFEVDRKWITDKNASRYGKIIGDSITGVLNGGKAFETYIHSMCMVVSKNKKPITWTTGDGFHITHRKTKELRPKQVTLLIPGARRQTQILKKIYSKDTNPVKMKSAISPNYVHSLDAELLRRVALRMKAADIYDTDFIHDSFGCLPNDTDFLLQCCKDEFFQMFSLDPLAVLDNELRNQVPSTKDAQKKLDKVEYPRIANLSIEKLFDSNWFFS